MRTPSMGFSSASIETFGAGLIKKPGVISGSSQMNVGLGAETRSSCAGHQIGIILLRFG